VPGGLEDHGELLLVELVVFAEDREVEVGAVGGLVDVVGEIAEAVHGAAVGAAEHEVSAFLVRVAELGEVDDEALLFIDEGGAAGRERLNHLLEAGMVHVF
jgi:hypothetical protein